MTSLCDRCEEEIEKANILDKNRNIDRFHREVYSIKLTLREWEVFSLLYLYKRPVTKEEFEDYIFERDISHQLLRNHIYLLRKKLINTSFEIKTFLNIHSSAGASYELIYKNSDTKQI